MRPTHLALATLLVGCSSPSAPATAAGPVEAAIPDAFTAVLVSTVGGPTAPVRGSDGRFHVVYELWLTNAKGVPATVEAIEVLDAADPSRVVATLAGAALAGSLYRLDTSPAEDTVLQPDESALVFVSLAFADRAEVPGTLVHRFRGTGADNPGARTPAPIEYLVAPLDVSSRATPVIGPPLAGERWVAINGCCSAAGAHRGAVQALNGSLYDAQRFAIDWMRLGPDGTLVSGDPALVESWHAYGEPVLAVADAVVVETLDGLDDQPPGSLPDPATITLETVDGNHVILDLGDGVFAFYAHLQKGSVAVAEGDRVTAGQVIGKLGNSGNTSAPHLHLHLMERPSAVVSDGIPMAFDRFELLGSLERERWYATDALTGTWAIVPEDPAGVQTDALPLDLRVVSFP